MFLRKPLTQWILKAFYHILSEVDGMPPWTAQKSSTLVPQYSLSVMHSNLWPGAHAFAVERLVFTGFKHNKTTGGFCWDDLGQDQWSEFTQIIAHQSVLGKDSSALWCAMIWVNSDHWSWPRSSQQIPPLVLLCLSSVRHLLFSW